MSACEQSGFRGLPLREQSAQKLPTVACGIELGQLAVAGEERTISDLSGETDLSHTLVCVSTHSRTHIHGDKTALLERVL